MRLRFVCSILVVFFIISPEINAAFADDETVRIVGYGQFKTTAWKKYGNSMTDYANDLAAQGWEITRFSKTGVVLKKTGRNYKVNIMGFGEWSSTSNEKYNGDDTVYANALLDEGWDLAFFTRVGVVLKKTGATNAIKMLWSSEWNKIARVHHGGDDTEAAMAFASEGWNIVQLSNDGIILKKTGKVNDVKVLSINEWNMMARESHGGDDNKMANEYANAGWEIVQLNATGIVLQKTGKKHEYRILGLNEWGKIAEEKYGDDDNKMANAFSREGWDIAELSYTGIVLKRTINKN
jgi:hypothetical protein